MSENCNKIGLLTLPLGRGGITPYSNMVDLLYQSTEELYLITGGYANELYKDEDKIRIINIVHQPGSNILLRIYRYIKLQIRISMILKKCKDVENWFFFLGGEYLIIPILMTKLLNKNAFLILTGNSAKNKSAYINVALKPVLYLVTQINFFLLDKIIIYSRNVSKEMSLDNLDKLVICHRHFINFKEFDYWKPYSKRRNIIGYIGRLSIEKGIKNLIESIPAIIKEKELEFWIIGDGDLKKDLIKFTKQKKIDNKVKFMGWASHSDLPFYLNEMKLLVLPSYSEGLPNVLLESMSCGTPVLASNIGAIPDLIRDHETGFLLNNNSPEQIKTDILRIFNTSENEKIVKNSRELVKNEFNRKNVEEIWRNLIYDICK